MQPDKWQQIKGQIQDTFKEVKVTKEVLSEPERGEIEVLSFDGPLGKMRVEYITRPVVTDKKTHGSRRIGSDTAVEYVYSEDEFSHQLKVYRWDEAQEDWVEIQGFKDSFSI